MRVLRAGDDPVPLLLFYPGGHDSDVYLPLVSLLRPGITVYGFDRVERIGEIPGQVAHHLGQLRSVQPVGPYWVGGWSLGGFLAWEAAVQLQRAGEQVELVAAIDAIHPVLATTDPLRRRFQWLTTLMARDTGKLIDLPWQRMVGLDDAGQFDVAADAVAGEVSDWLRAKLAGSLRVSHLDACAVERYRPGEYDGQLVLFRASDRRDVSMDPRFARDDPTLGWKAEALRELSLVPLPGGHFTVLREPAVSIIAERLNQLLTRRSVSS